MRIAVVTSLYPTPQKPFEGIFAARRWEGMLGRGHDVRVIHPLPRAPLPVGSYRAIAAAPRAEERAGVPIVRPRYWHWPGRARGNAARFARAAERALDAGLDVVVCDYAWPASQLAQRLATTGVPCVVNGRGSDVLQVAGEAGLAAELGANLRAASGRCAVSQDLVDAMDRVAGDDRRGRLVPNGVDTAAFSPGDRRAARARLGLPEDGRLVLVVGHLISRKDPLLALAAFAQGAPDDARLVFVGRGELRDALAAEISRLGLDGRVELAGERPPAELCDWYRAADVLLLTSRREGRPNVVLEALASGTPVLATAAGGTGEVLDDPRWLAEDREPARLAEMLSSLLQHPPTAEELRSRVEPLSWEASLSALEDLLEAVREGPIPRGPVEGAASTVRSQEGSPS